ncbi:hypothetical protein H8E88_02240 [candidate division KSB1 bacterium]|nr:hypothetical protein [candidate division KSB1 bacterium]
MELDDEKKIYKLLWEYLEASKKYEDFCKWSRKWHGKKQKVSDLPTRFIGMTRILFGDVHTNSFEDWWKDKKKDIGHPAVEGVFEYDRNQAMYEINTTIRRFVESNGREPTLDEFKKHLIERLFDHVPASFMCRAFFPLKAKGAMNEMEKPKDVRNFMVAQFEKLIAKKEKLKDVRDFMRQDRYIGKVYSDTMQEDLRAYCLQEHEGLKIREIVKKLDPKAKEAQCKDIDVQRKVRQKIARARTIIEDLERGYFPRRLE